jgi:hypothetical protein
MKYTANIDLYILYKLHILNKFLTDMKKCNKHSDYDFKAFVTDICGVISYLLYVI